MDWSVPCALQERMSKIRSTADLWSSAQCSVYQAKETKFGLRIESKHLLCIYSSLWYIMVEKLKFYIQVTNLIMLHLPQTELIWKCVGLHTQYPPKQSEFSSAQISSIVHAWFSGTLWTVKHWKYWTYRILCIIIPTISWEGWKSNYMFIAQNTVQVLISIRDGGEIVTSTHNYISSGYHGTWTQGTLHVKSNHLCRFSLL